MVQSFTLFLLVPTTLGIPFVPSSPPLKNFLLQNIMCDGANFHLFSPGTHHLGYPICTLFTTPHKFLPIFFPISRSLSLHLQNMHKNSKLSNIQWNHYRNLGMASIISEGSKGTGHLARVSWLSPNHLAPNQQSKTVCSFLFFKHE